MPPPPCHLSPRQRGAGASRRAHCPAAPLSQSQQCSLSSQENEPLIAAWGGPGGCIGCRLCQPSARLHPAMAGVQVPVLLSLHPCPLCPTLTGRVLQVALRIRPMSVAELQRGARPIAHRLDEQVQLWDGDPRQGTGGSGTLDKVGSLMYSGRAWVHLVLHAMHTRVMCALNRMGCTCSLTFPAEILQ